jgi:hypothetical protein
MITGLTIGITLYVVLASAFLGHSLRVIFIKTKEDKKTFRWGMSILSLLYIGFFGGYTWNDSSYLPEQLVWLMAILIFLVSLSNLLLVLNDRKKISSFEVPRND